MSANPQRQKADELLLGAGVGEGNGEWISFWGDENVLELDSGGHCTTL